MHHIVGVAKGGNPSSVSCETYKKDKGFTFAQQITVESSQAMASSQLCLIVFCLSVCLRAIAMQVGDGTTADPTALQYLMDVSETVPTHQKGNLMPDSLEDKAGFANTMHCFAEIERDEATKPNRRLIHFKVKKLEVTEECIMAQLVFKVANESHNYTINVYDAEQTLLDSKVSLAATSGWMEFSIHGKCAQISTEDHALLLEVTTQNGEDLPSETDLLARIKSVLVIYTYDNQSMKSLAAREIDAKQPAIEKRQAPTYEALGSEPCSLHTQYLTYEQMGWPGSEITVLIPEIGINYNFCYGHCNSPFTGEVDYPPHAQIIEALNQFTAKNLPPPCCVPKELFNETIIYRSGPNVEDISKKNMQDVKSCGCK